MNDNFDPKEDFIATVAMTVAASFICVCLWMLNQP